MADDKQYVMDVKLKSNILLDGQAMLRVEVEPRNVTSADSLLCVLQTIHDWRFMAMPIT